MYGLVGGFGEWGGGGTGSSVRPVVDDGVVRDVCSA